MDPSETEQIITEAMAQTREFLTQKKIRGAYLALKPAFKALRDAGETAVPTNLQRIYGEIMNLELELEKETGKNPVESGA